MESSLPSPEVRLQPSQANADKFSELSKPQLTDEQPALGSATPDGMKRMRISSASILRRGLAYFIDVMIINAFVYWQTSGYRDGFELDKSLVIITVSYFLLYFPLLEAFLLHATVGKALVGIKVVDQRGDGIKIVRSFCRHLCKLLFGIPTAFLAWFFAAVHPRGQAIHDVVAKSYVVVRSARQNLPSTAIEKS